MEHALRANLSLVKAWKADRADNLVFRETSRSFNPICATASKICVVEVEQIVENGDLDPDLIHTPGVYVSRLVHNPDPEKRIEERTVTRH